MTASRASDCCSGVFISLDTMSMIIPPYFGCNVTHNMLKGTNILTGHEPRDKSKFTLN